MGNIERGGDKGLADLPDVIVDPPSESTKRTDWANVIIVLAFLLTLLAWHAIDVWGH